MNRRETTQESLEPHAELRSPCQVDNGIFIRQKDVYKKYLFSDMLWIEASGNYSYIHLKNRAKIIVVEHLSGLESLLPPHQFIRIHRSHIVNINSIDAFIGNQLCIGDIRLSVSAPYKKEIMRCFTVLGPGKQE